MAKQTAHNKKAFAKDIKERLAFYGSGVQRLST